MGQMNYGPLYRFGINPFPETPRGSVLPIPCAYPFAPGTDLPDKTVPQRYDTPIPEGYSVEWIDPRDERVATAGFDVAEVWISEDKSHASYEEKPGYGLSAYLYLLDPKGYLAATWDEGRWWTPDESNQFALMLQVPATIEVQSLGPRGEYGGR